MIEFIYQKNLSIEQIIPFINVRLQQLKSLPTAADGSFPYGDIEDLVSIDTAHPSVVQFLDKANTKLLTLLKSEIESLKKSSSQSKNTKDAKADKADTPKHTPNFNNKPRWTNPTDKDPCFYYVANKGSCAGKTDCVGHTPRPHSFPTSATAAQKESFTKWIQSKDSPTYNK